MPTNPTILQSYRELGCPQRGTGTGPGAHCLTLSSRPMISALLLDSFSSAFLMKVALSHHKVLGTFFLLLIYNLNSQGNLIYSLASPQIDTSMTSKSRIHLIFSLGFKSPHAIQYLLYVTDDSTEVI